MEVWPRLAHPLHKAIQQLSMDVCNAICNVLHVNIVMLMGTSKLCWGSTNMLITQNVFAEPTRLGCMAFQSLYAFADSSFFVVCACGRKL